MSLFVSPFSAILAFFLFDFFNFIPVVLYVNCAGFFNLFIHEIGRAARPFGRIASRADSPKAAQLWRRELWSSLIEMMLPTSIKEILANCSSKLIN